LHLLIDHPEVYRRLKEELVTAFPDRDETIKHATAKDLPYLNATLYEVMRLRPMISGSQRVMPSGGAMICGVHLPEGVSKQYGNT
jgi:cytochrome P450